ncbi:MAG: hypothetical protein QUU85_09850 [Candidatus Eisenbacteria bacterium]|nr:hypothetical protein [Candidatus Eisenbacteria bacterium]
MRGVGVVRRLAAPAIFALALVACAAALMPSPVSAQLVETDLGTIGIATLETLQPSLVFRPLDMTGVRASAVGHGMGGAYVGEATDLQAISWNPAGLGWLQRPNVTGDLRWIRSSGSTSGYPDTFNIPNSPLLAVQRYDVNLKSNLRGNMLGAGISGELLGRPVAGAISFRRYLDTSYPEEIVSDLVFGEGLAFPVTLAVDGKEEGGVDAASASATAQLIPDVVSVGANLNYLTGRLSSKIESIVATGGANSAGGYLKTRYRYRGISADLGLQARRPNFGGIGVRFTPGYTVEVTGGRLDYLVLSAPGAPQQRIFGRIAGYDMDVPALLSIGGWFQPIPQVRVAVEVNRQNWSETKIEYREDFLGMESNPSLPLRDVTSFHIGAEGRWLRFKQIDLPLRIGYHRGPLSVAKLNGGPDPDQWAGGDIDTDSFTFGLGFETGNLRYDVAYEIVDYKLRKFYYESPGDPFINPQSTVVDVDRRVAMLRLTAGLSL